MMDTPITAGEIHEAVRTVDAALHGRAVLDMASWDRILSTMTTAYSLFGGTARFHLRQAFEASYLDTDSFREAIATLNLCLAQPNELARLCRAKGSRARTRRAHRREVVGQLRFDLGGCQEEDA